MHREGFAMDHMLSSGRAACALAACATLLAACGSEGAPGFLKGLTGKHDDQPTAAQGGGESLDLHPKEITTLAPKASVMLEKQCPNIVQPYRLADSASTVAIFSAHQGAEEVSSMVTNALRTGSLAPTSHGGDGISTSTRLAAKQVNWLPMNVETMYGERAHREETTLLKRGTKQGKKYYPVADKILEEVQAKIGQPTDYHFKLFIDTSSGENAMSRPGGYLYVGKGLLEDKNAHSKAYFAIAHEIAHVLQRHETFELQSMVVDSFSMGSDMSGAILHAHANPDAVLAHVKVGKNLFIRHHIDQELQADSCATRLLSRVFSDQQELADALNSFLKDLPKTAPEAPAPRPATEAERLSASVHEVVDKPIDVHPTSAEREANLRAMYAVVSGGVVAAGGR
jgi:Zn-dependent protease with chaperone function